MSPDEAAANIKKVLDALEVADLHPSRRVELASLWFELRQLAGIEVTADFVALFFEVRPMNGDLTWPPRYRHGQWPPPQWKVWPWSGNPCPEATVLAS
jgi:hypothetical protein